jgi:hypothetical protein
MKYLVVVLLALVAVGAGAFIWWQESPLKAFYEAGSALKSHNLEQFQKFVDEQSLLSSAVDDLVFAPIIDTPQFTDMQRATVRKAAAVAHGPIQKSLQRRLDAYVSGGNEASLSPPAQPTAVKPHVPMATPGTGSWVGVLSAASRELHDETARLKEVAYVNMQSHAWMHRDQLVCQLISSDKDQRKQVLKDRLQQYGLTPENFKGIAYLHDVPILPGHSQNCTMGFSFRSPKLNNDDVIVEFLMVQQLDGLWRISKVNNVRALITKLEPTYDYDMQELALATAGGITPTAAKAELKRAAVEILRAPETQSLLHRLKNKFRF